MIKLGIIGAGRLGSFHADKAAAHPQVELVGVSDPVESARDKIAQKHKVRSCATLDELISQVDAVVIASPTVNHFELGNACLRLGRHVLMEKPMCPTWSDAEKLVEAAKRSKAIFQVGHVEEFNPAWQTAVNRLDDVKAGAPVMIDAIRTSGYTFRSVDIGTVFDMMIHDIDLVLSLVPVKVLSLDAAGFNVMGGPHEDVAEARIRFENGSVANLFSSRVAQQPVRAMKIVSKKHAIDVDFGTRTTKIFSAGPEVLEGKFAPDHVTPEQAAALAPTLMKDHFVTETVQSDAVDALSEEMNDFVRSIQKMETPRVSGERALAAVAVAEMIVESIRKGSSLHFGSSKHVA